MIRLYKTHQYIKQREGIKSNKSLSEAICDKSKLVGAFSFCFFSELPELIKAFYYRSCLGPSVPVVGTPYPSFSQS